MKFEKMMFVMAIAGLVSVSSVFAGGESSGMKCYQVCDQNQACKTVCEMPDRDAADFTAMSSVASTGECHDSCHTLCDASCHLACNPTCRVGLHGERVCEQSCNTICPEVCKLSCSKVCD